jgi:glycosyltransferase involved in cell wall biosynthesis
MKKPLVEVIIAVFNGADYIEEAIASVQKQTLHDLRIIVADDGSSDTTLELVNHLAQSDPRIIVYSFPHRGVSATLNDAIGYSTAPILAFLDADDLYHRDKLAKQIKVLDETDAAITFCLVQEFESLDEVVQATHRARPDPMKGYSKIGMVARRSVFDTYGLFDTEVAMGDFVEWYSRVVRAHAPITMVEEVLAYRRVHSKNTTRHSPKTAFLHLIKKHLDEKRKSSN